MRKQASLLWHKRIILIELEVIFDYLLFFPNNLGKNRYCVRGSFNKHFNSSDNNYNNKSYTSIFIIGSDYMCTIVNWILTTVDILYIQWTFYIPILIFIPFSYTIPTLNLILTC